MRQRSSSRCAVSGIRASNSTPMPRGFRQPRSGSVFVDASAGVSAGAADLGGAALLAPGRLVVEDALHLELFHDLARLPAQLGHGLADLPSQLGEPLRTQHHQRHDEDDDELRHADAEHSLGA